eukprot:COSAG06_NODE_32622_length_503_cov_0.740099_1_plen_74_part_00
MRMRVGVAAATVRSGVAAARLGGELGICEIRGIAAQSQASPRSAFASETDLEPFPGPGSGISKGQLQVPGSIR